MAVPPRVGTTHLLRPGPALSFFFCRRLTAAIRSCVLTRRCPQRGRSGDNRGPRLLPINFELIAAVQGIISEVGQRRQPGAVGRVRWDEGQVSPVHLSQPSQPDRVSPISTAWLAQPSNYAIHGDAIGEGACWIGEESCDLTATAEKGLCCDLQP